MSKLGEFLDVVQKLIGVVGALIPVVVILFPSLRRWLDARGEQARHPDPPAAIASAPPVQKKATLVERLKLRLKARHALVELAFAVLLSAAFSVVFRDALLEARSEVVDPLRDFAKTVALTLFVSGLLVAAWFQRQLEFVTGTLAVTAMMVLLLAGQTSLLPGHDIESGDAFLFTLLALLAIATSALTFLFGNPFSFGRERSRTMLWGIGVVLVVVLAAAIVGRQKVRTLEANPRAPSIYSKPVDEFSKELTALPLETRKVAYQLASELQLASNYRSEHDMVELRLRRDRDLLRQLTRKKSPPEPTPAPPAAPGEVTDATPEGPPETGKPAIPDEPEPPAARDGVERSGPLDVPNLPEHQVDALRLSELQHDVLVTTLARFRRLAPSDRVNYLLARLAWTHPLGSEPGETRAATSLPGTTSVARFDETSRLRIEHAFAVLENRPDKKPQLQASKQRAEEVPLPVSPEPQIRGVFEYGSLEPTRRDSLFPPFAKDSALVDLRTQLTWPVSAEAWAAYEEYTALALFDAGTVNNQLFQLYAALSDNERASLREFVAVEAPKTREERFVVLEKLATALDAAPESGQGALDLKAITDAKSRYDITLIARKLAAPESEIAFADPRGEALTAALTAKQSSFNADDRKILSELLTAQGEASVQPLFSSSALAWIREVRRLRDAEARKGLFSLLAEPIRHAVLQMARDYDSRPDKTPAAAGAPAAKPLTDLLDRFGRMTSEERESALLRAAKELYGAGGFFALLPHEQLVYQARTTSLPLGILFAGLLTLPFFTLAVVFGTYLARKLRSHYQRRALLDRESLEGASAGRAENALVLGQAIGLRGRDPTLQTLEELGRRGWTTTAVVGRRGVGKSRALYELLRGPKQATEPRIAVWVSVPTDFEEREFVVTILDRLAEAVEGTVARFLGAEPLPVRQAEARLGALSSMVFLIGGGLVWALASAAQQGVDPTAATVNMVPTAALLIAGALLLGFHVLRLQPVNLEPWLERDRTYQVATVLLYREARRVRALLNTIRTASKPFAFIMGSVAIAALSGLAASLVAEEFDLVDFQGETAFVVVAGLVLASRLWRVGTESFTAGERGFMMLVSCYRSFARSVVRRLNEGALGSESRDARIVIAIDELDKMSLDKIRIFVRRIKAVFEVPGVYYYVSISEDALSRLYLGVSGGKDEFDSSFDHIVQVEPLPVPEASAAAAEFLRGTAIAEEKPSEERVPEGSAASSPETPAASGPVSIEVEGGAASDRRELHDVIGVISFGVPRDILRRADEARTWRVSSAAECVQRVRARHAQLGYRSGVITRQERELVVGPPELVDEAARQVLAGAASGHPASPLDKQDERARFWMMAWTLAALAALVSAKPAPSEWHELAESLRDLGYRIPVDPCGDLAVDLRALASKIFGPEPAARKEAG